VQVAAPHEVHALPLLPQALFTVPGWHTPPEQQPPSQLAAEQVTHTPPVQGLAPQLAHAPPSSPHAAIALPVMQVPPSQQPEQLPGPQPPLEQAPPEQMPAPQLLQARPPVPHMLLDVPLKQTPAEQQPPSHVDGLHDGTHAPALQSSLLPQFAHATPARPQPASEPGGTQVAPLQQPVQLVTLQIAVPHWPAVQAEVPQSRQASPPAPHWLDWSP